MIKNMRRKPLVKRAKKQQNKKTTKQKSQKKVSKKEKVVEHLLRQEVSYFKGLSFFLIVLIFLAMAAYGILFGAMYLETKLTRLQMEVLISELSEVSKLSEVSVIDEGQNVDVFESEIISDLESYSFFENKILSLNFPKAWTYVDVLEKFEKVYFFTDSEVRDFKEVQQNDGDFIISLVNENNFSSKSKIVNFKFLKNVLVFENENNVKGKSLVYILPNKTLSKFLKLEFFLNKIDKEVIENILDGVVLK